MKRLFCFYLTFTLLILIALPCAAYSYDDDGGWAVQYEYDHDPVEDTSSDEASLTDVICGWFASLLIIPLFLVLILFDR